MSNNTLLVRPDALFKYQRMFNSSQASIEATIWANFQALKSKYQTAKVTEVISLSVSYFSGRTYSFHPGYFWAPYCHSYHPHSHYIKMATNSSSSGYWVGHKSSKESQNGSWLYHQASSNSRPSSQYTYVNSDQLSLRSSISKENNSSISNRTATAPKQQRATKHASVLLEETSACLRSIPLSDSNAHVMCIEIHMPNSYDKSDPLFQLPRVCNSSHTCWITGNAKQDTLMMIIVMLTPDPWTSHNSVAVVATLCSQHATTLLRSLFVIR